MRRILFVLVGALCITLAPACKRKKVDAATVALDQTYSPSTSLFVAHYPKFFAASLKSDGLVVFLQPSGLAPVSSGSALILTGNVNPVSNDVKEYERILLDAQGGELTDFKTTTLEPTTCLGHYPGLQRTATYKTGARPSKWVSCTFLAKGHGFSLAYGTDATADMPLLQRIADATEIR